MIVTQMKPLEEIDKMIEPHSRVLIVGCDGCCQPPRSIHEANTLGKMLKLKRMVDGKDFSYKAVTVLRQCDDQICANALRSHVDGYEAMISLSCGIGVQMMNKIFPSVITYPAQNTMFNGGMDHTENEYTELCEQCGDCMLGETGGICPVAGCAKHLLNGPCGGQIDGMCEVGDYERPCAWVSIYKRLKQKGRIDLFQKYRPMRDFRLMTSPGYIKLLDLDEIGNEISEFMNQEGKA
mgnify:FL=1